MSKKKLERVEEVKPLRTTEEIKDEYGKLAMVVGHNKYQIFVLQKQIDEFMAKMLELNQENAKVLEAEKAKEEVK